MFYLLVGVIAYYLITYVLTGLYIFLAVPIAWLIVAIVEYILKAFYYYLENKYEDI